MNVPLFSRAAGARPARVDRIVPEICVRTIQVTNHFSSLKDYRTLQSAIGSHAQTTLDRIVADVMHILPQDVSATDITCFDAVAGNLFRQELQMYQKTLSGITEIWMQACTGDLSRRLERGARRAVCPPLPQIYAFDRAVDWINGLDVSPEMQAQTAQALQKVIQHQDVRSRKSFFQFRRLTLGMQTGCKVSLSDIGERPCSEGTVQAIWQVIEAHAMGFPVTPGDEDPYWDDLACFLYGASLRAHGTVLAARAIYAATLLKGGRPFRAPDSCFDTFLRGDPRSVRM